MSGSPQAPWPCTEPLVSDFHPQSLGSLFPPLKKGNWASSSSSSSPVLVPRSPCPSFTKHFSKPTGEGLCSLGAASEMEKEHTVSTGGGTSGKGSESSHQRGQSWGAAQSSGQEWHQRADLPQREEGWAFVLLSQSLAKRCPCQQDTLAAEVSPIQLRPDLG